MMWFLAIVLWLAGHGEVRAYGVGQCHESSNVGALPQEISWTYPSDAVFWNRLEPKDNQFDWSELDRLIGLSKAAGKKIWIQVLMTSYPSDTVPLWVEAKGISVMKKNGAIVLASPWDPKYIKELREILMAMRQRYEVELYSKYGDTIEAVQIASGGDYGEMVISERRRDFDIKEMSKAVGVPVEQLDKQASDGIPL